MGLLRVGEGAFGVCALGGWWGEEGGGGVWGGGLGGAEEGGGLGWLGLVLVLVGGCAEEGVGLSWLGLEAAEEIAALLLLVLGGIAEESPSAALLLVLVGSIAEETGGLLLLRLRGGAASEEACAGRWVLSGSAAEEIGVLRLVLGSYVAEHGVHLGRILPVLGMMRGVSIARWWYSRLRCEMYVQSVRREGGDVEERMRISTMKVHSIKRLSKLHLRSSTRARAQAHKLIINQSAAPALQLQPRAPISNTTPPHLKPLQPPNSHHGRPRTQVTLANSTPPSNTLSILIIYTDSPNTSSSTPRRCPRTSPKSPK